MKTEESKFKPKCPICGTCKYIRKRRFEKILNLNQPFKIYQCVKCRLGSLIPQLTAIELKSLYSESYFNLNSAGKSKSINLEHDYSVDIKKRFYKFKNVLHKFKQMNSNSTHFLDVGAATGEMVNIANEFGFKAEGIELSESAVNAAKTKYGLNLMIKELVDLNSGSFEIVHLNHVFEHFNNPASEIVHLNRILKTDGILYIEIPYQFNLIENFKYIFSPRVCIQNSHSIHHPYFYTPSSINTLLENNGFRVLILNVFSLERMVAERGRCWKNYLWYLLSFFKIGNYIEVYAVKR